MKICEKCDVNYSDDKKFCKKCGSPLTEEYTIDPRELAKKTVYEERLKMDPLNIEILHEYCQLLLNNELYQNAVSILLKILAIDEGDEVAKEQLFRSYLKLKMYREAEEIGEQLLKARTADISFIEDLAEISLQLGNKAKAYEYYEDILKIDPTHSHALYQKAIGLLDKNEIENATNILKQQYEEGSKDRIVCIYAGINQSLSGNHKKAVEILKSCLSYIEISLNDTHNQRGLIYLIYSLCKTEHQIDEIDEWFSMLDFDVINQFQQPSDSIILAKATDQLTTIYIGPLQGATSSKIQYAITLYIDRSIVCSTEASCHYYAQTWSRIAEMQESLGLLKDAEISIKKAIKLDPDNSNYKRKLDKIINLYETHKTKQKRLRVTVISSLIALVIVIVISASLYSRHKENKAWQTAQQHNTFVSYQRYLRQYPNNRFSDKATQMKEDALWQETIEKNTVDGYETYLFEYPNGRFLSHAKESKEKIVWENVLQEKSIVAYLEYLKAYPNGKYVEEASLKVPHIEKIMPSEHEQILEARPEVYFFYLSHLGDETHWLSIGSGRYRYRYEIDSPNKNYEIVFSDGHVYKGGQNEKIPTRSSGKFKLRATKANELISIKVTIIN